MNRDAPFLFDTNAVIEAVRTQCWAPITGQLRVETVEACRQELVSGAWSAAADYVPVTASDLGRLSAVHAVDAVVRASFKLSYPEADSLDRGEHDLLAYAHSGLDEPWVVCSPDKASIRAGVALGFGDRLCSLEEVVAAVGASPRPPLRHHFKTEWLVSFRTKMRLEGLE